MLDRLPFNWKTPLRYLIVLSYEYVEAAIIGLIYCLFMCFFVGSCILVQSFIKDIITDLSSLNQIVTSNEFDKKPNKNGKLSELFCRATQNHSDVQQLSVNSWRRKKKIPAIWIIVMISLDLSSKSTKYSNSFSPLSLRGSCLRWVAFYWP